VKEADDDCVGYFASKMAGPTFGQGKITLRLLLPYTYMVIVLQIRKDDKKHQKTNRNYPRAYSAEVEACQRLVLLWLSPPIMQEKAPFVYRFHFFILFWSISTRHIRGWDISYSNILSIIQSFIPPGKENHDTLFFLFWFHQAFKKKQRNS